VIVGGLAVMEILRSRWMGMPVIGTLVVGTW
jgi:hypothetical protein